MFLTILIYIAYKIYTQLSLIIKHLMIDPTKDQPTTPSDLISVLQLPTVHYVVMIFLESFDQVYDSNYTYSV